MGIPQISVYHQPPRAAPLPPVLVPSTSWGMCVYLSLLVAQSYADVGIGQDLDRSNPCQDVTVCPGP